MLLMEQTSMGCTIVSMIVVVLGEFGGSKIAESTYAGFWFMTCYNTYTK
jgi:hypothetical protein